MTDTPERAVVIASQTHIKTALALNQEIGSQAVTITQNMWAVILDILHRDATGQVIATPFQADPDTYQKPVIKLVREATLRDDNVAVQLQELVARYEKAVQAQSALSRPTYQATVQGSGVVVQGTGNKAVASRGVMVEGNVGGSIITGSGNTFVTHSTSGVVATIPAHLAPLRDQLVEVFNKSELEHLCFDLGVAHDDLPGETRTGLAQALVGYCHQRGRLGELLARCRVLRPKVGWEG
ncbi:MAG: hypothetical protein V9G20_32750 [Candidatus Promineifilaceae bacterium]